MAPQRPHQEARSGTNVGVDTTPPCRLTPSCHRVRLPWQVEQFKEDLYHAAAQRGLITEDFTHRHLRIKIVHFGSYRELPEVR